MSSPGPSLIRPNSLIAPKTKGLEDPNEEPALKRARVAQKTRDEVLAEQKERNQSLRLPGVRKHATPDEYIKWIFKHYTKKPLADYESQLLHWNSHHIGFSRLRLDRRATTNLGNPHTFGERVKVLVFEHCNSLPGRSKRSHVEMAHDAFALAFLARETRHLEPESSLTRSICREPSSGSHTYQRELMRALRNAADLWLQEH